MKKQAKTQQKNVSKVLNKILFITLFLVVITSKGWGQIYQHNFGTTAISTCPYTVAPSTLDANLSNSSWTNSTSAWTSYAGSAGQAIGLSNSSGTPTITLTFNVANGYSLALTSFSFYQLRSATGAQNWSMTVNGTAVGSGTVPTTAANTGSLTPTNTISGLTGTITVVISLSGATGTGTYRLDDFTLNGSVTATACTPISTFPWTENFDAMSSIGTDVTPSCWLTQPSAVWASMNAASITYNDPNSSPNYMTCYWDPYTSTDKYLITPGFALTSGVTYTFGFKWAGDGNSGWDADVRYNTTQTGVGSTLLGTAFLANGTTTTSAYTNVSRTFTPGSSGTYYFMVHVVNTVVPYYLGFDNFSLTSNAACITPGAPTSVVGAATGTTTANLSWAAGTPAGSPTVSNYWVVGTSDTVTYGHGVAQGATTGLSATTAALNCGTSYYLRVYAYTSCNGTKSAYTTSVLFTTNACVMPNCPILTTPANGATNVGTTTSLNWTAPTGGGTVSYYKLYLGTNNPPTNIDNGLNIGNVLTYAVTALSTNTTYYWKVTAVNAAGESSGCTVNHFKTSTYGYLHVDTTTYNIQQLIQNYFISGCVETKNFKFKGSGQQVGYFVGGGAALNYDNGIVLSTGKAVNAEGDNPTTSYNSSTSMSSSFSSPYGKGDSTIASMISTTYANTYDAAVLEFDFKPSSNNVSFNYVFGSDEYNEFVNTGFNDAFGFFLSGGPQNYVNKNIALIPNTTTPVSINNVNNGNKAATGVNAASLATGPCTNCAYYRDNADGHLPIECDGLTTTLTATASVTACQWYHIKLAIADVEDNIFDSWVFLQANSFSSGAGVAMNVVNPTGTKNSYEGCTSQITFTRPDSSSLSIADTVHYSITGNAVSGTDYITPPNPIIIPAGTMSYTVPFVTINDGLNNPTDTIIFAVTAGGCICNPTILRDTIYLHNFVGVAGYIKEPDTLICQGKPITLHGIVTAGNYYKCTWTTGATVISHNNNITVTPLTATTYTFTVVDSCGNTFNKSVTVNVDPPVSAPTSANVDHSSYCLGSYSTITLNAVGGSGSILHWFKGSCNGTSVGTGNNLTITAPTTTTTYYVAWSNTGCGLSACTPITVTVNPLPVANAGVDTTINNGTNAVLHGSATLGSPTYNYSWTPSGLLVSSNIKNPTTTLLSTTTTYTLSVTDSKGCASTDQVIVHVVGGPFTIDTITATPPAICFGDSTQIITQASGGSGNYSYLWTSNPAGFTSTSSSPYVKPTTTTIYCVVLTDGFTKDTAYVTVHVNPLPIAYNVSTSGNGQYCVSTNGVNVTLSNSQVGVNYELFLNGVTTGIIKPGTASALSYANQLAGTYTIVATNTTTSCVNTMSGSATVIVNPLPLLYNVSTLGNGQYCASTNGVTVELSNSQVGVNYELYLNGTTTSIIKPGTGAALDYTNQPAGNYIIIATNATTGCKDTMSGSATVIENPLPNIYNISTSGDGQYCALGPGVDIILSNSQVGVNYDLYVNGTSANVVIPGTGSALTFSNQPAGTYIIIASNSTTNCKVTMTGSATVIENPLPNVYNVSALGNGQYCALGNGVTVELSNSQVGVNYELMFNGSNTGNVISGTGSAIDYPNQPAGNYTIVATNVTTNCVSTMNGSATVIQNPLPIVYNVNALGNGQYCASGNGVTVELSGSQLDINYELFLNSITTGIIKPGTGSTIDFTNQAAGTYTIVATNVITNCKDTMSGSATIIVNPLPVKYNATGTASYCSNVAGVPVCLNNSQLGVNYQLTSNGNNIGTPVSGTGSSICFGTHPAGTYTVIATNTTTLCQDTMTGNATVTVNPVPVKYNVTGTASYCSNIAGVTVCLSNSEIGVNYQLSNGTNIGLPVIGTGSSVCFGTQSAGTYIVIATNTTTLCQDTMTGNATITVNPVPVRYNVTGTASYCSNVAGVPVCLNNSQLGVNYQLTSNGNNIGTPVSGTGSSICFGTHPAGTYTVIATNTTTLCQDTMTGNATVTVNPVPVRYNVTGSGSYCVYSSGVPVCLSNSQLGVNYQLSLNGNNIGTPVAGTGSSICFGNQPTGTYLVFATNTTTLCMDTMTGNATITVNPLPIKYNVTGTGTYCSNLAGVQVCLSNSETGVNYQLLSNGISIGLPVSGNGSQICFGTQPAGTYLVIATNTTTFCIDTMTGNATVTVNPIPFAYNLTGNGDYCATDPGVDVKLSNSETGVSYLLMKNALPTTIIITGTGSPIDFGKQPTGLYTVDATNVTTHCINTMSGSATVVVHQLPTANAGADTAICVGTSTTLNSSGGISYKWLPITGLSSANLQNPIATPSVTTVYTVTVTDQNSCSATDNVKITVNDYPQVSLTSNFSDNIGYMGSNVILNATPSIYNSYQFVVNGSVNNPGSESSYEITTLLEPQTAYVIVGNNNCYKTSDTLYIKVKPLANAFTPNNDGINDKFLTGLNIKIFNRWGMQLYEGKDGWDGKYKGELVSPGTYFYVITITDKENNSKEIKGAVTLVVKN